VTTDGSDLTSARHLAPGTVPHGPEPRSRTTESFSSRPSITPIWGDEGCDRMTGTLALGLRLPLGDAGLEIRKRGGADLLGDLAARRAAFPEIVGGGSREERLSWLVLADAALRDGREYEALVLARRGAHLAEKSADLEAMAVARRQVCSAFVILGDWDRFDRALASAENLITRMSPEDWSTYRAGLLSIRADVALARAEYDEALRVLESMETECPDLDPRWVRVFRAQVHLGREEQDEARADLEGQLREKDLIGLRARYLALFLLHRDGLIEEKRQSARSLLKDLLSRVLDEVGAGRLFTYATGIGAVLEDSFADARYAYDIAGAAALRRVREIDGFLRTHPVLRALGQGDLDLLRRIRGRFEDQQKDVLKAVLRLFEVAAAAGDADIARLTGNGPAVPVCAWCCRVRAPDGLWLPIGQYLPPSDLVEVSHGLCMDCLPGLITAV